jgi:hypothetical protein
MPTSLQARPTLKVWATCWSDSILRPPELPAANASKDWSRSGAAGNTHWDALASDVRGRALRCADSLAEQAPEETLAEASRF